MSFGCEINLIKFNIFVEIQSDPLASALNQQNTQTLKQPVPVYIPTPKHILEARRANGSNTDEGSARKKPKLEYVPKARTINHEPIPTYIPSSLNSTTNVETSNLEYEPTAASTRNNKNVLASSMGEDSNGDDISGLLTELSTEQITNDENTLDTNGVLKESTDRDEVNEMKESQESKSKENRHKSSSSSSRHRHHSSSHKSSHSERKGSSSSRSSSSSHRSSHHSSRKSKHSDKDKEKEIDKESKDNKQSSKPSSSKDKHRSSEHRSSSKSSSSSRHHSSSHSDRRSHSNNNNSSKKEEDCKSELVNYESDDDGDDDVEAQCRLIFDEFDPSTIENQSNEMADELLSTKDESDDASTRIDDAMKRKRVAYENADKQVKSITSFRRNADHVKSAMQVRFTSSN